MRQPDLEIRTPTPAADARHGMLARRALLKISSLSLGAIAMESLLADEPLGREAGAGMPMQHAPRARHVIYVHLAGGPSQVDLLDPKPMLAKYDEQPLPESVRAGKQFAFIAPDSKVMASPYRFAPRGQCGTEMSDLMPRLGDLADEITVVRSMVTSEFSHGAAEMFMLSGHARIGRPTFGAWVSYGLGKLNDNLPSYVVLTNGKPFSGTSSWGSGFLPSRHQGVEFRNGGSPIQYLADPAGITRQDREDVLATVNAINRHSLSTIGDPEIATRIAQYELAGRMQRSVPELSRLDDEPCDVLEDYGATGDKPSLGRNCLLARRLIERGVRFVQIFDSGWDHHTNIHKSYPIRVPAMDRAVGALLRDLKRRGLLDQTLVVWGGEFGRTPMVQLAKSGDVGRDHHRDAFSMFVAGGGVRRGHVHGATDDFCMTVSEGPVSVHDLHATLLHLLGYDHERLVFRHQGRDFRLTDVAGRVVKEILA
jgi:hypothetical protein